MNKVIGIEGQVAAGKTSICKELVKRIPNSIFLDGGSIYRAIVEAVIKSGINLEDVIKSGAITSANPVELMQKLKVEFKVNNGLTEIFIDGRKIEEDEIQSVENSMGVSRVTEGADNTKLFLFAKKIIDMYKQHFNIIVSSRGLAMTYPEMDCHVLISADLDKRVERRYKQYNGKYTKDEIKKMIMIRDEMHEKTGFNTRMKNTIDVDVTNCENVKESTDKVYEAIIKKIN